MARIQIQEVEAAVIGAIATIQEMSGRECPGIARGSKPIGDVPGFDSLNALEATILVAERLNVAIPDEVNIFINEAGDEALSVGEIAKRVIDTAQVGEGTS